VFQKGCFAAAKWEVVDSADASSKVELQFGKGSSACFAEEEAGMLLCLLRLFEMDSIIDGYSLLSGFQVLCVAERCMHLLGLLSGMDSSMAIAIGTIGNLWLQFEMGSSSLSYSYSLNCLFMSANF
jgi:hypothetical protein